jgi:hypothetical protein
VKLIDSLERFNKRVSGRLKRKDYLICIPSLTPNEMYWTYLGEMGIDDKAIAMIDLPNVEYQDTWFYIKTFRKG